MKKLLIISMIFLVVFFGVVVTSEAAWSVTDFSTLEAAGKDGKLTSSAKSIMGTIVNVIKIVGTGIAIIMLTYVAIKYMSAAPNEKAEFKKSATGFIVGAVVLFATTQILGVIANFATTNIP